LSDEKSFLSRWSDRKIRSEVDETKLPSTELAEEKPTQDEFEGKSDDEILTILELPDPETLKLGDTVEKFMDGRVPERIRLKALRAFWKTNPVLANIDGLDEYCEDYTDAAMVVENLQTIYQVGKGYAVQALDALESLADDEEAAADAVAIADPVDQSIENNASNRLDAPSDDVNGSADPEPSEMSKTDSKWGDEARTEEEAVVFVPRARRMQFN
jgi:hypothetical protein